MIRLLAFCTNEFLADKPRGWGAEVRFRAMNSLFEKFGIELVRIGYRERQGIFDDSYDYAVPKNTRLSLIRLVLSGMRVVKAEKCDGLYSYHTDSTFVIVPTFLVAKICRKPFFVVLHDNAQRKVDAPAILTMARQQLRVRKRHLHRRLLHFSLQALRRVAIRNATVCICVSNFAAGYASESLHVHRIAVTGNGVDLGWFTPPIVPKEFIGSFLGRVEITKGIDTLFVAWKDVLLKEPSSRLLVIGSSDEEPKVIQALISRLSLKESIVFAGYVSEQEAITLLASSRIFIFPSRQEGFGLSVAQAMAAGLPCIVSDIPALVENYGKAAIVVPVGDGRALADAIVNLLKDPVRFQMMVQKGRETVSTMTWEGVCEKESRVVYENLRKPWIGTSPATSRRGPQET